MFLEEIEITLANTIDNVYTADLVVYLENSDYKLKRNAEIVYVHYDTGGWLVDSIDVNEPYDIVALSPYSEDLAISDIEYAYNGSIELVDHNTDLDTGIDEFVFSVIVKGENFDYTTQVKYTYLTNNSFWKKDKTEIIDTNYTLKNIDGIWYCGDSVNATAIHFDSINYNKNNSVSSGTVTIIDFDHSGPFNPKTTIEKERNTYNINFEQEYSYEIRNDSTEYYIINSEIAVFQDKIYYYGRELSKVNYLNIYWLRESCKETCKKFENIDINRHLKINPNDPSRSITKKDILGIWNCEKYYYGFTEKTVNFLGSNSIPSTDEILKDKKIDYKFFDINYYGYDYKEKSYIVYYYDVGSIKTFKFFKKSNGDIKMNVFGEKVLVSSEDVFKKVK